MPVKGLTDRESVSPRLKILGKIKKGKKTMSGGTTRLFDLDHFRFFGYGPEKDELERIWFEAFGSEPRSIPFYLPYDELEQNWSTWMEKWTAKAGLEFRCNGEFLVQWVDSETKQYHMDYALKERKPCPYCSGEIERTAKKPGDTLVGRLTMVIEAFWEAGYPGYVMLETSSKHDLAKLTMELMDLEKRAILAGRVNRLAGIGCSITREKENVGVTFTNKQGKRVKSSREKWMLHIAPSKEWSLAQLEAQRRSALGQLPAQPQRIATAALPFDEDVSSYVEPSASDAITPSRYEVDGVAVEPEPEPEIEQVTEPKPEPEPDSPRDWRAACRGIYKELRNQGLEFSLDKGFSWDQFHRSHTAMEEAVEELALGSPPTEVQTYLIAKIDAIKQELE